MDEKTNMDGNQPVQGGGSATPTPSTTEGQLSAENFAALQKQVNELAAQNRGLQKGLDKRLDHDIMPVIKQVAKRLGIDEAQVLQAQRDEVLDSLIAERLAPQSVSTPGTGAVQTAPVEVTKIASQYGLDANDASFVAGLGNETDATKVELAIARRAHDKANQPSPTAAQGTAPVGGNIPQPKVGEELVGEYTKQMLAARGNKALGEQIKAEFRKKGCPVDKVIFGV